MSSAAPSPFAPEVVAAIARHMNDDHAADNVVICRALGGRPDATAATMTGMTPDGIVFAVEGPHGPGEVTVAWSGPITERAQVRVEVVRMYDEAAAALGLPARAQH